MDSKNTGTSGATEVAAVQRLMRGESQEAVSRGRNVPGHRGRGGANGVIRPWWRRRAP